MTQPKGRHFRRDWYPGIIGAIAEQHGLPLGPNLAHRGRDPRQPFRKLAQLGVVPRIHVAVKVRRVEDRELRCRRPQQRRGENEQSAGDGETPRDETSDAPSRFEGALISPRSRSGQCNGIGGAF